MGDPATIAARIRRWENGPQGPVTLELYPTLVCNLSCSFCDTTLRHQKPTDELSDLRLIEIVEEAAALGATRLFVLGGGEPLVRRQATPAVMRRAKELGMEGILTTNGTIFPPGFVDQLLHTGWDEVHVSVDGPTAAIHDRLRGQAGAFDKTVKHLCRLNVAKQRAGLEHPRLALHFVLTNQNHRTLSDMVRLAHALGCFRVDFDALIAYQPEQQALQLSDDERAEVPALAREALQLAESLGIATTLANFLDPRKLQRGTTAPEAPTVTGDPFKDAPCLKAWHYLVVQADGRTSPCCVLAGEGSSVSDTPVQEVWERSAFLERVREGMLAGDPLPRCRECSPNILAHERVIASHL